MAAVPRVLTLMAGLLLLAWPAAAAQLVAVPPLNALVLDLTGTLTPDESRVLETRLDWIELSLGAQIAVVIIPTTGPESINAYGLRAFNTWGLGRRDVNDGVLLLVARDDRTVRIEVGLGLEQAIPDDAAAAIIRDIIVPAFRKGDFAGGLARAVSALVPRIQGAGLPRPRNGTDAGRIAAPALRDAA
jgi:uncharacterized protein